MYIHRDFILLIYSGFLKPNRMSMCSYYRELEGEREGEQIKITYQIPNYGGLSEFRGKHYYHISG